MKGGQKKPQWDKIRQEIRVGAMASALTAHPTMATLKFETTCVNYYLKYGRKIKIKIKNFLSIGRIVDGLFNH